MTNTKNFTEDINNYVFTTRFVIEDNCPIVLVSHDDEGDWQFLSEEGPIEDEARIVLLHEIIQHDPTILEVADLPIGSKAFRDNMGSPWRIRKNSVDNN